MPKRFEQVNRLFSDNEATLTKQNGRCRGLLAYSNGEKPTEFTGDMYQFDPTWTNQLNSNGWDNGQCYNFVSKLLSKINTDANKIEKGFKESPLKRYIPLTKFDYIYSEYVHVLFEFMNWLVSFSEKETISLNDLLECHARVHYCRALRGVFEQFSEHLKIVEGGLKKLINSAEKRWRKNKKDNAKKIKQSFSKLLQNKSIASGLKKIKNKIAVSDIKKCLAS